MDSVTGDTAINRAGLPHSDIPGSMPAYGSPRLFAVGHVLLRLSAPRHPPCALSSLTIFAKIYLMRVLCELPVVHSVRFSRCEDLPRPHACGRIRSLKTKQCARAKVSPAGPYATGTRSFCTRASCETRDRPRSWPSWPQAWPGTLRLVTP